MDSGLYAAYNGLLARTQALDLAANNLANSGTSGFRAGREVFRGVLADAADALPSQVGGAVNDFGVMGNSALSEAQGQIQSTGNPLDLALEGRGYFMLQTANGVRYTRDGSFRLSASGVLETANGAQVLDANAKPITVPSGEITVAPDGSVAVTTPGGSAIVGRIAVMDLGAGGAVPAENDTFYKAAAGSQPRAASASIQQGALESSNQDVVHGTMALVLLQRQTEMMQRALSVFHNDFDKTATEELCKV